jgi:hypothetical protein
MDGTATGRPGACRNLKSCFVDMKHKQTWLRPVRLATVSVAAVIASGDHMDAASRRNEPSVTAVESRTAGEPIMAIVSLRDQRITVYDKSGWIPSPRSKARRTIFAG